MIRRIGEARQATTAAPEERSDGQALTVMPLEALCEAIDDLPGEAQHLLFTSIDGEHFIYWGETPAGPWQRLSLKD